MDGTVMYMAMTAFCCEQRVSLCACWTSGRCNDLLDSTAYLS